MKLAKNLERLGTESAFSVLAEAKALEAKGNPMIHLGLGQPDFKTPKHVVEAAKKALDDGHHGYVMSNGIPECRQAVTRWIKKRYSVNVDFERILIMPGGKPTASAQAMTRLLERAGVPKEILEIIPDIVDTCAACRTWSQPLPQSVASVNAVLLTHAERRERDNKRKQERLKSIA